MEQKDKPQENIPSMSSLSKAGWARATSMSPNLDNTWVQQNSPNRRRDRRTRTVITPAPSRKLAKYKAFCSVDITKSIDMGNIISSRLSNYNQEINGYDYWGNKLVENARQRAY